MGDESDKKAKIETARERAVQRIAGNLNRHFNSQGRSLCPTWIELANKLGLSTADISALKVLVASRGLQGPKR